MQRKYRVSLIVLAVSLAAGVSLSSTKPLQQEKSTCCKKAIRNCQDNKKIAAPAENFSDQFIAIPASF